MYALVDLSRHAVTEDTTVTVETSAASSHKLNPEIPALDGVRVIGPIAEIAREDTFEIALLLTSTFVTAR